MELLFSKEFQGSGEQFDDIARLIGADPFSSFQATDHTRVWQLLNLYTFPPPHGGHIRLANGVVVATCHLCGMTATAKLACA